MLNSESDIFGEMKIKENKIYRYKDRDIVLVISGETRQPFYRSTGRNSGCPGTWFPFSGIGKYWGGFTWFIKDDIIFLGEKNRMENPRFGSPKLKEISASLYFKQLPSGTDAEIIEINSFLEKKTLNDNFWRKRKIYAGIGSRKTPPEILERFKKLSSFLAKNGFTLRSGGANGADLAFESGSGDNKEIYLPWKGFNGSSSPYYNTDKDAGLIVEEIHPAWDKLSDAAKKLHCRNCCQILGEDLNIPCGFVVCWTPEGKAVGGTATAIKLAEREGIPVFNFGKDGADKELWEFLQKELDTNKLEF